MHTSERVHKILALLFLQILEMNLDHNSNCQLIGLLINNQWYYICLPNTVPFRSPSFVNKLYVL